MMLPRWHGPTIVGRLRSDAALLVLMGLVVALTAVLTAAVLPVSDRAADRATVAAVRDAGLDAAVVATLPRDADGLLATTRDPRSADELRGVAASARAQIPPRLATILQPGVTTVTTPALHLLVGDPGRYLQLTYADTPTGSPAVTYLAGGPPGSSAGPHHPEVSIKPDAAPWPVQVAVSRAVARALGVKPGDHLTAEDDRHRPIRVRISGVFSPVRPREATWQLRTELLGPVRSVSQGVEQITGGALVSAESLPDLRLAVPSDDLAQHITYATRASHVRWHESDTLAREFAHLQVSPDKSGDGLSWDSSLGQVLADARARITAAQGQAQVILVGLIATALLVLALAARLLVSRRSDSVTIARERGASLLDIAGELFIEAVLVAAIGTALGLATARLLAGGAGWTWCLPVLAVAALAAPVQGAVLAARATSLRRVPANRSARRTLDRARRMRRLTVEIAVLAAAVLCLAALRQRGLVQHSGWSNLTAAGAATACAVAGTLIGARLVAPALRLSLRAARRSTDGVGLLVAARLSRTAARVLPLLAVSVAVAQLTFGIALAATEQHGQEVGALLAVGGDARLTTAPDTDLVTTARQLNAESGVQAAATGRVADDVQLVSQQSATAVRLVVVDATAYRRLLARSALPDAPQLARLHAGDAGQVPALLLGGGAALRDSPVLRWRNIEVPLDVVGTAPRVDASIEPVVLVDTQVFAAAGAVAAPNTVWAVGPGAAKALTASSGTAGSTRSVATYADELDARRHAPLASALVRLAAASSMPLLIFAILAVVLAAAAEAPARGQALGRLRALGLADADLRKVLAGELVTTVVLAAVAGLALGLGCVVATFGSLSLEQITGQTQTPRIVVPWWIPLMVGVVVLSALVVALGEWRRLRRRNLALLLRS
ncbi:FtsX-like permease family protein [Nocardioides sp. Iso805N]|uniref:FtsX-like permease family protein n=1 Tax=Nocardioides sp. Iso805N TaxID=1283287 RepID=UPI00039A3FBA|nr:FtsX-like permease family protein [Nocardioides sp. Iso805N]